jgi:tetratricopeptide (TPR) repeat protein
MPSDEAVEALERREYKRALALLERDLAGRSDGELHALAGLASFQLQDYRAAAQHYAAALHADGRRNDWCDMLDLAQANATAGVNEHVPALHYFDREALLAPGTGALPTRLPATPQRAHFTRLRLFAGDVLGHVATVLMDGITELLGRIAGYRGRVWTTWYRRPLAPAILTIAYMREQLNAHNLNSTYSAGILVGFQCPGQPPPPGVSHFRTADGSWNNLADPKEGAAGTRFLRNVELSATRPETAQLLAPNPTLANTRPCEHENSGARRSELSASAGTLAKWNLYLVRPSYVSAQTLSTTWRRWAGSTP